MSEATSRPILLKKVFSGISQNSQENTFVRVSHFNKDAGLRPATLLKERFWYKCFSVTSAKFLCPTFFTEHLQRLLQLLHFMAATLPHKFIFEILTYLWAIVKMAGRGDSAIFFSVFPTFYILPFNQ